ncbi:neutral zinc metallopeptidase [Acrocarpospora macrocephala]|uniref:Peptidase n=1 Tax=Acrocarpospora macrocephala TaxID=150177 RepID=A0A5M3WLX7_9ACTN|nr:neutral zinc metallopeptidase [Acrocarpospora macrocephala]GES07298.1 peptidase [Acrocarpospora macrocephala]
MKKIHSIVLVTLSWLLLSGTAAHASSNGTAHARYPIKDSTLTDNDLYYTSELESSNCREKPIKRNNVASAKRYVTAILDCLNRSWGAHFEDRGLPFEKARVAFITKPRRYCGNSWGDAAAMYCDKENRFTVLLNKTALDDPFDLFLFDTTAHEYGHHIQNLMEITSAYEEHAFKNKSELYEQSRRHELQAECLAGVFIGSVWDSLSRNTGDWKEMLALDRQSGDEGSKIRSHGKGRNIAAWLDRGFKAVSPEACNTWAASSAKVA